MAGVGVVFSTASLTGVIACLEERGIEYTSTESGSVYVLPEHACGILVELVEEMWSAPTERRLNVRVPPPSGDPSLRQRLQIAITPHALKLWNSGGL